MYTPVHPSFTILFTNTMNETLSENPGARDCLNIHGGRVDSAESINSDKSSYTHVMDFDTQPNSSEPLTLETNSDLPKESGSSVIIHEAEIHASNSTNDHDEPPVASSQEIFRPYNMDDTITNVQNPEQSQQNRVLHERISRPAERVDRRKTSSSLSESRLRRASRDSQRSDQPKSRPSNSKTSQQRGQQRNVTESPRRGDTNIPQQGATAGTSSGNQTNEHANI